jgi:hypothetical protein
LKRAAENADGMDSMFRVWRAGLVVVTVLVGLTAAYFLGADRAAEVRDAVQGVRRHEGQLEEHARRLARHDVAIAAQAIEIAATRSLAESARSEAAAARRELLTLRAEVAELKADVHRRDGAHARLLERLERLERVVADRAP